MIEIYRTPNSDMRHALRKATMKGQRVTMCGLPVKESTYKQTTTMVHNERAIDNTTCLNCRHKLRRQGVI